MARGYGYRVYLQPILPEFIDLESISIAQETRNVLDADGWMDTTILAPRGGIISEHGLSLGEDFYLTLNQAVKTITNAALASNVATLTVGTGHGFTVGNRVKVADLPSPFASLNGSYVITASDATTISYAKTGTNITSATVIAGTATSGTDLKLDGTDAPFRLFGIEDGPYNSSTDTEESPTWDDEAQGFKRSEATAKSGTIAFSGLANFNDAAYNLMQICENGNVARSLFLKMARVGPSGYTETRFGYGRFDDIKETNAAGGTVKWATTYNFDGPTGLVRHQ